MILKTRQVGVAFLGNGTNNNGAFFEGLNMATIWKLPVLFICENNQFATEVSFSTVAGNPSVTARGAACGIHAVEVDGDDVLAVEAAAQEAVSRARAGQGPTLNRHRALCRHPSQRQLLLHVSALPRFAGRRAFHPARCQGPPENRTHRG